MSPANDPDLYERHAREWWDPHSRTFRSLRSISELRVGLIREWLQGGLAGLRVADLGCGGGLLSVPLAGDGARLVGVDLGSGGLAEARSRCGARFVRGDLLRAPLQSASVDLVVLADVVEHLANFEGALLEAARVLVPGGFCFVSTLNRTRRAKRLAVDLAEGVGLVPRGTHDARLFVAPEQLESAGADAGLRVERIQGESIDLWRTLRRGAIALRRSDDTSVTYCALLRKGGRP